MTATEQINSWMNSIIDETHPLFTAISDEELITTTEDYDTFTRDFLHTTGKKFRMFWRVYYGTPETVRTVFEPASTI